MGISVSRLEESGSFQKAPATIRQHVEHLESNACVFERQRCASRRRRHPYGRLPSKADRMTTAPTMPRPAENRERRNYSVDRRVPYRILTLERITSKNLAMAIAAAWEIFPYEGHDQGFWPEVAYKMAIRQQNPRFAYYLARDTTRIVGITGHDPAEGGEPEMWLGWFGVLPAERQKGYGSKILLATCELICGFGISSLYIYSGDRDEERVAHHLYLRTGFEQTGWGKVEGEPVLYFKATLPLVSPTEIGNVKAAPTGVLESHRRLRRRRHPR